MKRLFLFYFIWLFLILVSCDTLTGPAKEGYIISGSFGYVNSANKIHLPEDNISGVEPGSPASSAVSIITYENEEKIIAGSIDSNGDFSIFISEEDFLSQFFICFTIPKAGHVFIELKDSKDKRIRNLVDEFYSEGSYNIRVDLSDRVHINYITDEIRIYADKYWHYADEVDSKGDDIKYNYWT